MVRDAHDVAWSVKFGPEVFPECFSSRYVSALGYLAEPTYYLASGQIQGAKKLKRAHRFIMKDGSFTKARFELRDAPDFKFMKGQSWSWIKNPFLGSHELAGLKIVVMLLSNWDPKDARDGHKSNIGEFRVQDQGQPILFDGVFDWGAGLGKWGSVLSRDQSDCVGYTLQTPHLVRSGPGHELVWGYVGKHGPDVKRGITVEDVRWLLPHLQRITPEELRAGLKASGATDRQTACWAHSIETRVGELQTVAK